MLHKNLLKNLCLSVMLGSLAALSAPAMAANDAMLQLIEIMHKKGSITDEEYGLLKNAAKADEEHTVTTEEKVDKVTKEEPNQIKGFFKDGIGFESADHKNSISINGRVQADYRNFGKSDAQNTDVIDLRRAYLTAKGKIYNDYEFNVTGDFAQGQSGATTGTSQLDVAYFGINWWDQAKFRFGQFDMPFGLEHLTSDLFIDFQERSLTEFLVPGKERGAMIHGKPFKGFYYGLAASTGRGKNVDNADDQVDGVDAIGRLTVNFAEIMGNPDAVYHIGGDFSRGDISPNQSTGVSVLSNNSFAPSSGSTEGRGIKFFSPTAFTALPGDDVTRTRYGVEGALAYGPVKFQSEYFVHNYDGTNSLGTTYNKDISAWYAAVNWLVTGEKFASTYKDGVWGRIKPKNDFIHPASGGFLGTGAVELSLRYSGFDANDFTFSPLAANAGTGNAATGTPTGAHAVTAGVQWILNPNARLMANYIYTKFKHGLVTVKDDQGNTTGTTGSENAFTVRAQFDF